MPNKTKSNGSPASLRQRVSFAKTPTVLELPNLIETQKRSYASFMQRDVPEDERETKGLQALFKEVFPIFDFKETTSLEFVSFTLSPPTHDLTDCQARGLNYQVRLQARLMCVEREKDEDTGQTRVLDITESDVYLGDIPLMTENGTFIVNGSERVIVNQLQRSPGVIFLDKSHTTSVQKLPTGQIIPYRGAWIEFEFDSKDCIHVRLDRKKKLLVTVLLRALGWQTDYSIPRCMDRV
jgi:DNA-directed RNA polymerase subunit beta